MDRVTGIFVDGMGAASATSGVLTQLQGRIFAFLYLQPQPVSLEEIAAQLETSKSNVSVNIRGLADWHLVRRVQVPGSRKDHYEAATNLLRVMQQIIDRRFRFNLRQVLATVEETQRAAGDGGTGDGGTDDGRTSDALTSNDEDAAILRNRLQALHVFFSILEANIGAFARGEPFDLGQLQSLRMIEMPAGQEPGGRRRKTGRP
ncbi:MAG: MarR family transcriptional regulator [Deltaproteobacteria bacterium]|nr:MarR family transcriptional regulator [Deltaproteobacteria bacterium]